MTTVSVNRDLVKRQLAAARAVLTVFETAGMSERPALDTDLAIQRLVELELATEGLARAVYTLPLDPEMSRG